MTNAAKTIVAAAEDAVAAALCAPSMEKFGQTRVGHMQLHSHIGVLNLDPCPLALPNTDSNECVPSARFGLERLLRPTAADAFTPLVLGSSGCSRSCRSSTLM